MILCVAHRNRFEKHLLITGLGLLLLKNLKAVVDVDLVR